MNLTDFLNFKKSKQSNVKLVLDLILLRKRNKTCILWKYKYEKALWCVHIMIHVLWKLIFLH